MLIRNEKGLALPLVLMVMFVTTLLGTAVLQYSVADSMQVARDEHRMQAYYLARSGADAMAEFLIKNPARASGIIATTSSVNMATGSLGAGKVFGVDVLGDVQSGITIIADGTSGAYTARLNLLLTALSAADIFRNAITTVAKGDLDVSKMKEIRGDLESGGRVIAPPNYPFNILQHSTSFYPSPIIPNLPRDPVPARNPGFTVGNNQTVALTGNHSYERIEVNNNGTLIFEPLGNIMRIVVGELVTKGNIAVEVHGSGRLELYITDYADIQTPLVVNPADPDRLFIFLGDNARLDIQANATINAYIYGPNANVGIQSGNTVINGAIIANRVTKGSNQDGPSNGSVIFNASGQTDPISAVPLLRRHSWGD